MQLTNPFFWVSNQLIFERRRKQSSKVYTQCTCLVNMMNRFVSSLDAARAVALYTCCPVALKHRTNRNTGTAFFECFWIGGNHDEFLRWPFGCQAHALVYWIRLPHNPWNKCIWKRSWCNVLLWKLDDMCKLSEEFTVGTRRLVTIPTSTQLHSWKCVTSLTNCVLKVEKQTSQNKIGQKCGSWMRTPK